MDCMRCGICEGCQEEQALYRKIEVLKGVIRALGYAQEAQRLADRLLVRARLQELAAGTYPEDDALQVLEQAIGIVDALAAVEEE